MRIDRSRFPLLFLRETSSGQTGGAEAELEAILAEELPFVLITDLSPEGEANETPDAKKARAMFFKRNREILRRYCAGAIVIEGSKITPMPVRLAAQALGKAFGIAFRFVPDEHAAVALGEDLLSNRAANGSQRDVE